MVIDNYYCIDSCIIIRKDLVKLDSDKLDALLNNCELAKYDIDLGLLTYDFEKPNNWDSILPKFRDDNYLPMLRMNLSTKICKVDYTLLKCDMNERLHVEGINTYWLDKYLPNKNLYFNPNTHQFTMWDIDDKLMALIMPCYLNDNTDIRRLVNEINYFRAEEIKQKQKEAC